jgi:hypothetical protein
MIAADILLGWPLLLTGVPLCVFIAWRNGAFLALPVAAGCGCLAARLLPGWF